MDAVSAASSNRLLEAFERMGLSQGEGLVSSGPSPVPEALSRAFEHLMDQPDAQSPALGQAGQTAEAYRLPPQDDNAAGMTVSDPTGNAVPSSPAPEGHLLGPSELYRLQFQVAMLRHEADAGSQVTQKTSQGLDSLLRNQS